MSTYPRSITELFGIELPVILAPMLGVVTTAMIVGVAKAGGLGSLAASSLGGEEMRNIFSEIRRQTSKPISGHRGTFLRGKVEAQVGTMALVPQIVDAVKVPVIAAGGIGDPRGVAAAFALGASAVQVGTAFLFCDEANLSPLYRHAIRATRPEQTVITNIFTGRPARVRETRIVRELGPLAGNVPDFPLAVAPLAPLRAASEPHERTDFMPLWCGQAASLSPELSAEALTRWLMRLGEAF